MRTALLRDLLVLSLLATLVTGCRLPPPVYILQARPQPSRVPQAPPPARLEIPPPPPDESYVWQQGYWSWDDEYRWIEGSWVPPREGHVLIGASYTFVDDCWGFTPPYWCPISDCGEGSQPGFAEPAPPRYRPAAPVQAQSAAPAGPIRLPPIHVNAPPAGATVRVNAPPSEPPPKTMVPRWDEERRQRLGHGRRRIVLEEASPEGPSTEVEATAGDGGQPYSRTARLGERPEYRGTREGRPVFGDDPEALRPVHDYRTDQTGAIVLAPPPRAGRVTVSSEPLPRGRLIVVGPEHSPAAASPSYHRVPPPAPFHPVAARPTWSAPPVPALPTQPSPPGRVWQQPAPMVAPSRIEPPRFEPIQRSSYSPPPPVRAMAAQPSYTHVVPAPAPRQQVAPVAVPAPSLRAPATAAPIFHAVPGRRQR